MRRLVFAAVTLASAASFAAPPAGTEIVSKYIGTFNGPPAATPTDKMPDGPLLGNGDVGVALAGPAEAQRFYIGKNDFWTSTQAISVGRVALDIPDLRGATYRQEQDMARAEVRGTFTKDGLTVHTRSRVLADENLLLTDLLCDGDKPVPVSVRVSSGEHGQVPSPLADNSQPASIGRELHGGGRWYFDGQIADIVITNTVLDGAVPGQPQKPEQFDGRTTSHELTVAKMDNTVSVAAWIKISHNGEANYIVSKGDWNQAYSLGVMQGRLRWSINGTFLLTEEPLEMGQWAYVAGTWDGRRMRVYVNGTMKADSDGSGFPRSADAPPTKGRKVMVETRVIGAEGSDFALKPGVPVTIATAISSDLNDKDFSTAAGKLATDLTPSKIAELDARHRAWWSDYWSRSFIEIPDKEIEKHWYAALYAMGSCSRPGKTAPGLWGNWATTSHPAWQGDYHLNYNFQAPFYIVYSSNHADLSLPFYQALVDWLPQAETMAKQHGWKGAHYPVGIGPWGLRSVDPGLDFGQRSNGALAAMNFIWYWQYTQDASFLRDTGYPFLREIAEFWADYLKFEDGRYVIHNDSVQEGTGPNLNPIVSLGLVRTLFANMISMSQVLGVDGDKRAKWKDISNRLSAYPLQQVNGKTVFRYSEAGPAWWNDNTIGIFHIFPAGTIGLGSDPKVLEISRNMIDAMHRWHDPNGFATWYTACVRVGYNPETILAKLREECDHASMPNLVLEYGGGGIENVSGFLAVNEMLLQSHEGVLRFFPDWPRNLDARFGDLRAVGAFLVSAELKNGVISGVRIVSEMGQPCTVQNPWPGRSVAVSGGKTLAGARFTFHTVPGETVTLKPYR